MTTHYVDFKGIPDPETSPSQVLEKLYERLHLALVQHRLDNIGISFPEYSLNPRTLGPVLRLHSDESTLTQLIATDWLRGVRDHVRMTPVAPTPETALHRTVQRKQFKTSVERLRRRRMRRKGETAEQATQAIPTTAEHCPNLPYLHARSRSNGHAYCLFIATGPTQQQAVPGTFNSYGLSGTATVPWF
jgi:CRISPR-associated endonuclease Csy4